LIAGIIFSWGSMSKMRGAPDMTLILARSIFARDLVVITSVKF